MLSEQILIFFQIIFIDLVLAGDNAIIIGMVASQFPEEQRKPERVKGSLISHSGIKFPFPIIYEPSIIQACGRGSSRTVWGNQGG